MKTIKLTPSQARTVTGHIQERNHIARTLATIVEMLCADAGVAIAPSDRWDLTEEDGVPAILIHRAADAAAPEQAKGATNG